MIEPVRLAKRVAELMPCSRSEAEQYIEGGWVSVDGRVVEEPQFRVAHQRVEISPDASLLGLGEVTLLLHKPAGHEALLLPTHHANSDRSGIRPLSISGLEDVSEYGRINRPWTSRPRMSQYFGCVMIQPSSSNMKA